MTCTFTVIYTNSSPETTFISVTLETMKITSMFMSLCFAGHCAMLLVVLLCHAVEGQFPRACTGLETVLSKECCPRINGTGSPCGETEGRGQCDDITIDDEPYGAQYVLLGIDDRERWPERFFNRTCVCIGNFGGFDCSRCRPGWQGDSCQERRPSNVRQNIMEMGEEQRNNFLEVLDLSKTTPHPDYVVASEHYRNLLGPNSTDPQFVNITIYDLFTWNHYYSVRDTLLGPGQTYTAIDFSHEGPAFLTWHRMHLLALEDDLQRLSGDPTFALPYWNFAIGGSECDICTDELLGSQDTTDTTLLANNSRFADWEVVCLSMDWYNDNVKLCNGTFEGPIRRNPGGNVERPAVQFLPQPSDVESCVRVDTYDSFPFYSDSNGSFRNALEGYSNVDGEFEVGVRTLHNLAHLFLNGTGGITHASANDPIFVLLHAFTDAIFEEWIKRNNATEGDYPSKDAPIGHNLDFNMVPFFPPVKNRDMFVSSEQLGYSYSVQFAAAEPSETLATTESFIWASLGVLAFIVLNVVVALSVAAARRYKRRQKEENLYQNLITDDNNPGIMYTA